MRQKLSVLTSTLLALTWVTGQLPRPDNRDRGATATEYALLVAFIAIAIVVGVTAFGASLGTFFSGLAGKLGIG